MSLNLIERFTDAEETSKAVDGLLAAGRVGALLLKAYPQPLDAVAVVVNPVRTSDWSFVPLGWDRRTHSGVPDVATGAVAAVAVIAHDPLGCQSAWKKGPGAL